MIQAMVSVYPIGQADYAAVDRAIERLRAADIDAHVQSMHTQVAGDVEEVFHALRAAFQAAQTTGAVAMTITVTNACPMPTRNAHG